MRSEEVGQDNEPCPAEHGEQPGRCLTVAEQEVEEGHDEELQRAVHDRVVGVALTLEEVPGVGRVKAPRTMPAYRRCSRLIEPGSHRGSWSPFSEGMTAGFGAVLTGAATAI